MYSNLLRQGALSALALLALQGCRDIGTPVTSFSGHPQAPLAVAVEGGLRDHGIDLRDTYFAFNVRTTRTVEGGGAPAAMKTASMQMSSTSAEDYETDESSYLEAGYGSDGALRFNVFSDGAADPRLPPPPSVVRSVANDVYVYDEWGSLVESYMFDDFLEGAGLPGGELAVGSPYGSLYKPLGSSGGGGPGAEEPIYMTGLDPERTHVKRTRDDVLQITTTSGASGGAGIQAAGASRAEIRTTRTFRRRPVPTSASAAGGQGAQPAGTGPVAHWLLESVEQVATAPRGVTFRTRTTYTYVAGHINRGKDQERERVLNQPPGSAPRAQSQMSTGEGAGVRGDGAVASSIDGINLCETSNENYVRTVNAGGRGLVYQHGFCSNAGTWYALRHKVPETHRVGVEQTYSLNPDAPIEYQVDDLVNRMVQVGVGGNVVVAHSQGGLLARRLGQRRPDLVSGVVTIGTPHEGALIASRPAGMLADAINDILDDGCLGSLMCHLLAEIAEAQVAGLIARGIAREIPAAGDDQPGSALIQRVNGRSVYQYEQFRRASISMGINPRWALFRMIGDARSDRARLLRGETLKGRRYVRDAQRIYDAGRVLRYMAMVLRWRARDYGYGWGCHQSYYSYAWEPCYNPYGYSYNWWQSSYWHYIADMLDYLGGTVVWTMDFLDRLWDDATTGRVGGTDGFVQLHSQQYPDYVPGAFPMRRFQVYGYEAHSGETASLAILLELQPALDHAGLPRY